MTLDNAIKTLSQEYKMLSRLVIKLRDEVEHRRYAGMDCEDIIVNEQVPAVNRKYAVKEALNILQEAEQGITSNEV